VTLTFDETRSSLNGSGIDEKSAVRRGESPKMGHLTFFYNFSLTTGTKINEPH